MNEQEYTERKMSQAEQSELLVSEMARYGDYVTACAVLFAFDSGLNLADILEIQWHDIDLENATLSLQLNGPAAAKRLRLSKRTVDYLRLIPGSKSHGTYFAFPHLDSESAATRLQEALKRYLHRLEPRVQLLQLQRQFGITDLAKTAA